MLVGALVAKNNFPSMGGMMTVSTTSLPTNRLVSMRFLLLWFLLQLPIFAYGENACIDNLIDGADSRVTPDDHLLETLANQSLMVTWNDQPLTNLTLTYESFGTISVSGTVPAGAVIVLSRLSQSFRHAGSSTVIQAHDKVTPVNWTFNRVGTFAVSAFMVPDYETNMDNETCVFYASDVATFDVVPTKEMIDIGESKSFPECNLCPDGETLSVSEVTVFVPSTGVEQTCAGWFQDGINGKLNAKLCTAVQEIEANNDTCSCSKEAEESVAQRGLSSCAVALALTMLLAWAGSASL